jgi:hypothetical protein
MTHATGGPGNGRPQRYLRLARMRFDSLTPSAGPAINWSVEAPFFNRCSAAAGAQQSLTVSAEDANSITNSIKPFRRSVRCRVVDFTASLLQAAGESLLTISQRQVLSMPVHATHDSAATAPSPLCIWHICDRLQLCQHRY